MSSLRYPDCPHCGRDDAGILEHEGARFCLLRCVWCLKRWQGTPLELAWSREAEVVEIGKEIRA